jgi:zinc protease
MNLRVSLLLVALALLSLGAQQASVPRPRIPNPEAQVPSSRPLEVPYRQVTLSNGLTVILHRDTSVPIVGVNVWYHVGSANERPGPPGFAHLFEHLMFEGSGHVKEGEFDTLLESAGGDNNGSTENDRTNYIINVPSNALELALFLESDRMGYLLDTMSPARVNGQRDVVKNERRQSYDNRPYGVASLAIDEMLWPDGHPYHWPTIGSMEDLSAASYDDVVGFFKKYYVPNNASLVIAGDIDLDRAQALVEKWFGSIPRGAPVEPVVPPAAALTGVTMKTLTDRVQLPRLYLGWLTPRLYAPGDAALDMAAYVLAGGKNSRLYKRLVYDTQMAQDVYAVQQSAVLGGSFLVVATARPGTQIADMKKIIDEEIDRLRREPPDERELARAKNQIEASFYRQMERVGGFNGKAEQLNSYFTNAGGDPDYFAEDLARYTSLSPSDVRAVVSRWLPLDRRVELIVQPEKQP